MVELADTPKPVSPNMCWMLSSQPSICDDSLFTGTLTRNTANGSPGWPAMVPVGCPSWPTPVWTTPGVPAQLLQTYERTQPRTPTETPTPTMASAPQKQGPQTG